MIKLFIILSSLIAVLGHEYEIIDNVIDFNDHPYQRMPMPYSKHNNRDIVNFRSKLLKNAIVESDRFGNVKRPVYYEEIGEVTSLASIYTFLLASVNGVKAKILGYLKYALAIVKINIPAIVVGAAMTVGLCKVTSLCTKLFSIHSIKESLMEYSSLLTQETVDTATEFLQEAFKRFGLEDV